MHIKFRIRNAQDEFDKMAEKRMRKSLLPQSKEEDGPQAPPEEVILKTLLSIRIYYRLIFILCLL